MKIEQIYTGCLAQGAYYIVSENEAAIIDPLREVKPYLDRLEKDNVTLKVLRNPLPCRFCLGTFGFKRENSRSNCLRTYCTTRV